MDLLAPSASGQFGIGYWDWDTIEDRVSTLGKTGSLFGIEDRPSQQHPLSRFQQAIHREDRAGFDLRVERCRRFGGPFSMIYRTKPRSDQTHWVLAQGHFEADERGRIPRGHGIVLDVTRSHQDGSWIPSPTGAGREVDRVSSADFVRNFSAYSDRAIGAPVIVTRNGRDRLVVMPAQGDQAARKGGGARSRLTRSEPPAGAARS